MRVLMTADAVGGVWSYAMTLCASLEVHGIDVTLATLGPRPGRAQRTAAAQLDSVRLFESDHRLEWMPDGWRDQQAAGEWLMKLADAESIDLVHLNSYAVASMPWDRPTICVAHSCVSSWWRAVHGVSPPPEWDAYQRGVVGGLNAVDRVVAPSNAFLSQLYSCYEVNPPAQVIHNGIPLLEQNGPSQGRSPIVFACGRPWDAAKNMGVLDKAARQLPWPVYVAGDLNGPDGGHFSESSLHMLGSVPKDDVASWLRRASIFVHPALYEPFGLAVAEAAASGCALLLADILTLRELWDGAAEFFDPHDADDLAAALQTLIADSMRRERLGVAARQRAADYSAPAMANAYRRLYETLVLGASSAAASRSQPQMQGATP